MASQQPSPTPIVQSHTEPYHFFGFTFASKQVLSEFCLFSLLIIGLPLAIAYTSHLYLSDHPGFTEPERTAYSVVPSIVLINIFLGVYVYRVVKDPQNYKKDPPLVVTIKPKKE